MNGPNPNDLSASHAPERRDYLVDHCRVEYRDDSHWQCECRQFAAAGVCRHTREVASMRAAQTVIRSHLLSGTSGLRAYVPRPR